MRRELMTRGSVIFAGLVLFSWLGVVRVQAQRGGAGAGGKRPAGAPAAQGAEAAKPVEVAANPDLPGKRTIYLPAPDAEAGKMTVQMFEFLKRLEPAEAGVGTGEKAIHWKAGQEGAARWKLEFTRTGPLPAAPKVADKDEPGVWEVPKPGSPDVKMRVEGLFVPESDLSATAWMEILERVEVETDGKAVHYKVDRKKKPLEEVWRWDAGALAIGRSEAFVSVAVGPRDISHVNLLDTHFEELEWARGLEAFAQVNIPNKGKFHVFLGKDIRMRGFFGTRYISEKRSRVEGADVSAAMVLVDAATGLPWMLFANGIVQRYEFSEGPKEPLVIPAEFLEEMKKLRARIL